MGLFGKSKGSDPKEQVNGSYRVFDSRLSGEWMVQKTAQRGEGTWETGELNLSQSNIAKIFVLLERTQVPRRPQWYGLWQVTAIRREEAKVTRSLKEAAKKGDKDVCKILARCDQPSEYRLTIYCYAIIVSFSKYL